MVGVKAKNAIILKKLPRVDIPMVRGDSDDAVCVSQDAVPRVKELCRGQKEALTRLDGWVRPHFGDVGGQPEPLRGPRAHHVGAVRIHFHEEGLGGGTLRANA